MRKMWNKLAWAGAAALLLAGCAGTSSSVQETETSQTAASAAEEPAETTVTEPETTEVNRDEKKWTEGVTPLTSYVSDEEMAKADLWSKVSDNAAIAAVMRKAAAGEKVTIACIGGSITQGTISNGSDDAEVGFKTCYADLFHQWWTETFPDTEIEFINAGIGATGSYIGVHRVQKDVLDYDPDLVLVEFSVNDDGSNFTKTTYDNLVRRIYQADSNPAVLLLFMGQTSGSTAQETDVLVGYNYQTPMVSYINVINDMMLNGVYSAEQLSGDTVHPSALGHAIVGEILWKYLNNVNAYRDTYEEPAEFTAEAVTNDKYLNAQILDSSNVTPTDLGDFEESSKFSAFPNDWSCTEGDGDLTFTINCKNLGLLYYCTTDGKSGQFEVYVDGELTKTLDADFTDGWGNYAESAEVYTSDEAAEHTIVIKKAADSTGDAFTVLGLLVSE
jgi:lysophospholipase L1-like esterase